MNKNVKEYMKFAICATGLVLLLIALFALYLAIIVFGTVISFKISTVYTGDSLVRFALTILGMGLSWTLAGIVEKALEGLIIKVFHW